MNIVGIQGAGPETAAALLTDGRLTALAEERLNGRRHSDDFPVRATKHLIAAAGLTAIDEIDLIVVSDRTRGQGSPIEETIRARLAYTGPIRFLGHHAAHGAAAFLSSPFDDAAVLVIDHAGNLCRHLADGPAHYLHGGDRMRQLHCTYRGGRGELTPIDITPSSDAYPFGILGLGSAVCRFLNFGPDQLDRLEDLATCGGRKPLGFEPFLDDQQGAWVCRSSGPVDQEPERFGREKLGGLRPRGNKPLPDDIYTEIAHKAQGEMEEAVLAIGRRLQRITRARNLCVGGAITQNGGAMTRLAEAGFENLHIFPSGGGVSVATGCALSMAEADTLRGRRHPLPEATIGPDYPDAALQSAFTGDNRFVVSTDRPAAIEAAEAIIAGRVVGWFQGGSEAGLRGAGHRSILVDPTNPRSVERLATLLGPSEPFHRFGVSILEEFYRAYFDLPAVSPAMTLRGRARPARREAIASALRSDGTVRVQTVSREGGSRFYRLLEQVYQRSGLPLVVNAPMQPAGQPRVETPEAALALLADGKIDQLFLGPYAARTAADAAARTERPKPIERQKGMAKKIKEAFGFR